MSSYWIETTKNLEKKYPSLTKDIDVDVCIIGGGLVGITSAYLLSDSDLKVVVLERDNICSHVSGNSTAKITSQHNLFYDYLINSQGHSFAKGYLKANEEAIQNIKSIIEKENKYEDLFKATRLEPIKNHEELGNMIKESMYSLVINKLKSSPDTLEDVQIDEGKIIEMNGEKIGVYRDENGKCFFIKPVCAHLGCELSFNNVEKTWDCPCHGSRYDIHGKVISEPAINDLEKP